jgi:hypothetical protein
MTKFYQFVGGGGSYVYEKICHVEEKEDISENSEFTCFCKILRSYQFLQVRLIIIIE